MLEVNNLSVTARSGAQLLNQISFQIEIGEAIGLTGQSGAGKTTLLKALLGILSGGCQVSGGTIQWTANLYGPCLRGNGGSCAERLWVLSRKTR